MLDRRRPSRAQQAQRILVEQLASSVAMALRAATGSALLAVLKDEGLNSSALVEQ